MKQTSIQAFYQEIKPTLGQRQEQVFKAIKSLKGATNTEIARHLNKPINTITPRTNELVKMKQVYEKERRLCNITKM